LEIEPAMSHRKLVIVPTYNELENISDMVRTVMELEGNFELLVIDDGSPDGTASVVKSLQNAYEGRLHLVERAGKQSLGTAYIAGYVVNWPMGRVLMSYFASKYVNLITGLPIQDATAGFKCYHRSVLEGIALDKIKFIGYAFQIEMKFTAWKLGFKLVEVPIIFTDRTRGQSKMSPKIFKEAVLGVILMKLKSIFKPYRLVKSN